MLSFRVRRKISRHPPCSRAWPDLVLSSMNLDDQARGPYLAERQKQTQKEKAHLDLTRSVQEMAWEQAGEHSNIVD